MRLHAYGLSNQTLQKWFSDSLIRLAVSMVVGFASGLGSVSAPGAKPEAVVAVHGVAFGSVSVRRHADQADLDRSALFNRFGPMKDQALEQKILALAERAGIEGSRVFEVERASIPRRSTLT